MFHPATLLLAWAGLILVLPLFSPAVLMAVLLPFTLLAMLRARRRTLLLLRRARWLLLSLALLFALATPGVSAPGVAGDLGMTQDGLVLGAEHVLRLLLLLVTLSVLHEAVGTTGLVSGLYWLLLPLQSWRGMRERIVVRLLLVIDYVENGNRGAGWRGWLEADEDGPPSMMLTLRRISWWDGLVLGALAVGVAVVLAW